MKLVVGGCHQGKTVFAKEVLGAAPSQLLLAYHLTIRQEITAGLDPVAELKKRLSEDPGLVIVSDEVGMGIVPLQREEREYREAVGRTLCVAAAEAAEVYRVIAGLGERIK